MSTVVSDTRAVFAREMTLVMRDPFSLAFSIVQPLVFLALFGPLLGATVGSEAFGGESSLQWFLPGVIVMLSMFGTTMTGSNLQIEMNTGSYERVLATPLSRSSLLAGRALKEFAPLVVQAVLLTVVTVPFGFDLYPVHVLAGLVLLGVFGIGVGALSYSLALVTRKNEWVFWMVQQSLLFPLLILSGIMLPLESAPGWMKTASSFNPLTYVVEAERTLFGGTFVDRDVAYGALAAALTCVAGVAIGIRTIRRSTS
jgi:ABC-2 type transport system permease protein